MFFYSVRPLLELPFPEDIMDHTFKGGNIISFTILTFITILKEKLLNTCTLSNMTKVIAKDVGLLVTLVLDPIITQDFMRPELLWKTR